MSKKELRQKCLEYAVLMHKVYADRQPSLSLNPIQIADKFYEYIQSGHVDQFYLPESFTGGQNNR